MDKKTTAWVSTNKKKISETDFNKIKAQISQNVSAPSPISTAVTSPAAPITTFVPLARVYYIPSGSIIYDDQGERWGEVIDMVPVGDSNIQTDIQLNAVLSRTDDSNFELPTRAQSVTDVWFDNLNAEPTYHYFFIPETTITTVAPQGSGVIVTALYLNRLES